MKHLLFSIILLFPFYTLCGEASEIEIITPTEHSIFHEEFSSVVIKFISPEVEGVIITAESNQSSEIVRQKMRNTYCKTVSLIPGENTITVTAIGKEGLKEKLSVVIYHDIVSSKKYKYPPEIFTVKNFHVSSNEKVCIQCHKMEVNETPGIAFENPTDSNCYSCHKKLTMRREGHAPAINWLCTSCHQIQKNFDGKIDTDSTKFTLPNQIGKVCLNCHKKEKEIWDSQRFHHMPVDADQCTRCHNPHSSENRFYLKAKPWVLCTSCHIEKISDNHILITLVSKKHPTQGKPDPSRPGKELECISCHNPHAADTRSMIKAKSPMSICIKCHKK